MRCRTLGRLLLPFLTACVTSRSAAPPVLVNQVGYLPGATKIATIVSPRTVPHPWELRRLDSGAVVASGDTAVHGFDEASGDSVHHADFSATTAPGTYRLRVVGRGQSVPFKIARRLYPTLPQEAMAYFYFHRLGTDIDARFLQYPEHARAALHSGDARVSAKGGWTTHVFNVRYAWADAGDFGVYLVNHAVANWTLANLYERYGAFPDGALDIPERANSRPDLLDELLFGARFVPGALPPEGLATHKIHNDRWSPFPVTVDAENAMRRQAMPPSTNATWAVARITAHLSRLVRPFDPTRASRLLGVAEEAYARARAQPDVDYVSKDEGGGSYPDEGNDDDHYAAAVELYLTTGDARYRAAVISSPHYGEVEDFGWADVSTTATLSLLAADNDLPAEDKSRMADRLVRYVDELLARAAAQGYPVTLPPTGYVWGSNSQVVNHMLLMAHAYDLTADKRYLRGMHRSMDYLMGTNPMRLSYVTGYGVHRERDLHDRWGWAAYLQGTPFPHGWLVGGPNDREINDAETPKGRPAAKSYAAADTAPGAWCSKENAINWNAPLVWVSWYLEHRASDLAPADTRARGGLTAPARQDKDEGK